MIGLGHWVSLADPTSRISFLTNQLINFSHLVFGEFELITNKKQTNKHTKTKTKKTNNDMISPEIPSLALRTFILLLWF